MNQIHLTDYVRHDDLNAYFGFNGADQWKLHMGGGDSCNVSPIDSESNLNIKAPVYYDDDTAYYRQGDVRINKLEIANTSNQVVQKVHIWKLDRWFQFSR